MVVGDSVMCPACLGSAPVMAAGAVSTGGLTHTMAWVRHHDRYSEGQSVDLKAQYVSPKAADSSCGEHHS